MPTSASLWGCELKCPYPKTAGMLRYRQPPCEAVSWNLSTLSDIIERFGQPPCEAVSWNIISTMCTHRMTVSLLVRLWVEIWKILQQYYRKEGQPPCEAVSWNVHHGRTQNKHVCQPPCEAVSWNIKNITHLLPWPLSASLWGCELKST